MGKAEEIEVLAAEWVARADRGLSREEDAALADWLASDVKHRVAWLRLDAAWRRVLDPSSREVSRRSASPVSGFGRWRLRHPPRRLAAAALAAATLAGGSALWSLQARGFEMETAVGGRSAAPLPDGSRIELNTDTRLRVDVRPNRRRVWIDKGEAYFEVASDHEHPFVIQAGKRRVTVLGTRFSIRRDGERLEVAVAEGRVRVEDAARGATQPRIVTVGDQLVADGPSMRVMHPGEEAVDDDLSWRRGLLAFQDAALAEVLAELNRYNKVQLAAGDTVAADLRIGGVFDPLNISAFTSLLRDAYNLRVSETDGVIYIYSANTGLS